MSVETRVLALIAGIAILAGPRRTRPLAGFLYGVMLSRVHGAGRQRLEATIARLFDERQSVRRDVAGLTDALAAVEQTVNGLKGRDHQIGSTVGEIDRALLRRARAIEREMTALRRRVEKLDGR